MGLPTCEGVIKSRGLNYLLLKLFIGLIFVTEGEGRKIVREGNFWLYDTHKPHTNDRFAMSNTSLVDLAWVRGYE